MEVSAKDAKLLENKGIISQLNTNIAVQTELIRELKRIIKLNVSRYRIFLHRLIIIQLSQADPSTKISYGR